MATTLRSMDNASEAQVAKFLDKNFYPKHTSNFKRFYDIETQMSGVDVQFDHQDLSGILVDEKASTHYVNRNIPTFAFELDFKITTGDVVQGWFYDEHKRTEYYLLSWIRASRDRYFQAEDIIKLDTLLVSRVAIQDMLSDYGMTKDLANAHAQEIRSMNIRGVSQRDLRNRPYYFYYSDYLSEAPINLIVRKEKLIEIATARFDIRPA